MLRGILSLFDGISCGRLALDRAGIKYNKYYASEIDKYAIAIARYNFPDTIFVGDVRYLNGNNFHHIDLIMGGSPCQGFSFAGRRQGIITKGKVEVTTLDQYLELKEQGFEFEGQSYLFWEYVRLLKEIKPKWFLLENVKMVRKWRDVITNALGVEPVEINSALVSAQNRVRLYWTNIPVVGLPEDRGILLKGILDDEVDDKYYYNKYLYIYDKPREDICKRIGEIIMKGNECIRRVYSPHGKLPTLTTMTGGHRQPKVIVDRDKSLCIDANYYKGGNLDTYLRRCRRQVVFVENNNIIRVRKLTPVECERLQTIPDNYTKYGLFADKGSYIVKEVSDTQRYRVLGNAWTVDVISWILSFIEDSDER